MVNGLVRDWFREDLLFWFYQEGVINENAASMPINMGR